MRFSLADAIYNIVWGCSEFKHYAALSLIEMGTEAIEAVPTLIQQLTEERNPRIRAMIVCALYAIKDERAFMALENCLANDTDRTVLETAETSLCMLFKSELSTPEVLEAFSEEGNQSKKTRYLFVLARREGDQAALAAVKENLQDENPHLRVFAVLALANIQPNGWDEMIYERHQLENDQEIRGTIARMLILSSQPQHQLAGYSDRLQNSPSWREREEAATKLGELGLEEAIPVILRQIENERLGDNDEDVLAACEQALNELGYSTPDPDPPAPQEQPKSVFGHIGHTAQSVWRRLTGNGD